MVIPEGSRRLAALQAFFDEFALVSGLALNVPKTVLIPLDPLYLDAARAALSQAAPGWAGAEVAAAAKYLGVYVGHGRKDSSWSAPLQKYLSRAELWGRLGVGLHLSLQSYRVYIASVLLFVGQFEALPADWPDWERRACAALLPGPRDWIHPGCLKELQEFHYPIALKDVERTCIAAKARVAKWEAHGALRIRERARVLGELSCSSADVSLARVAWLHEWRDRAFVLQIARADSQVRDARLALASTPEWWQKRANWQKRAVLLITPTPKTTALRHWRRRLDKWALQLPPGHRLARAQLALETIAAQCQPRVLAACIRLQLNGWCTSRRFQGRGACRLGCGGCEDSIQHLALCPVQRQLFGRFLQIAPVPGDQALEHFLLMGGGTSTEAGRALIRKRALGIYALYRCHNHLRTGGLLTADLPGAFGEYLREGRRGQATEELG